MSGKFGSARPLRIVLATLTLNIGGAETQLVKLAIGLHARGHKVCVLALAGGGPLVPVLRDAGVEVRAFSFGARGAGSRRSPGALLRQARELYRVWRYLWAARPDVCHAYLYTCNMLVLPLAWAARTPLRIAGRRGPDPFPAGLRHRVVRLLARRAVSLHLCNSRTGATEAVRDEGVPASRVLVIPNGVEIPDEVADPAPQPPVGVVVAQLRPEKGHADLLTALAAVDQPPRVCLVGDGVERDALTALADRLGVADVVEFAGERRDARAILSAYQFAILPSHREGLPNAVLEAMAAGLPVIATAVGGVPDLVADGVTGILVPARDPAALATAIGRLSADVDLRVRLGAAARTAALDYSVPVCVDRHEAVYRQWLG